MLRHGLLSHEDSVDRIFQLFWSKRRLHEEDVIEQLGEKSFLTLDLRGDLHSFLETQVKLGFLKKTEKVYELTEKGTHGLQKLSESNAVAA